MKNTRRLKCDDCGYEVKVRRIKGEKKIVAACQCNTEDIDFVEWSKPNWRIIPIKHD